MQAAQGWLHAGLSAGTAAAKNLLRRKNMKAK